MAFKWRKWNRVLHRDLGYLAVGMLIIYGISGIALNHMADWNPNYVITEQDIKLEEPLQKKDVTKEKAVEILALYGEAENYKKHFFQSPTNLKIFIKGGSAVVDISTGNGYLEKISKRPLFYEVNYMHYNPGFWWTVFSDFFAFTLIFLAVSGLFIVKGKNGIKWRGTILTIIGIVIPLTILYYYLQIN